MGLDLGELQRYVSMDLEIKELEAKAKELKKEKDKIEEQLIDGMVDAGIQNMKIGDRTVYIRTQLWASAPDLEDPMTGEVVGKDWDTALAAMKAYGYSNMIETRVNPQRISSLIRELDDTEEGIPDGLAESHKISEKVQLIVRK